MAQRNAQVIPKPGKSRAAALTITHPNAAGIDIGSDGAGGLAQSSRSTTSGT